MMKILKGPRVFNVDLDQCPYGAHTKKSTKIVTTSSWMASVSLKCEDVRPHFHLPGGLENVESSDRGMGVEDLESSRVSWLVQCLGAGPLDMVGEAWGIRLAGVEDHG